MALLFERAFSRQGSQPNGRPRPNEWVRALQDLEQHLKKCTVNPAHQFVDTLSKCPWCEIEAVTGVPLFPVVVVGSAQTGFTIAEFWAKVNSVPNPGPPPALPGVTGRSVTLSSAALELQQATFGARFAAGFLALIGAPSRIQSLKKEIATKAADARSRWQNLQTNWDRHTSSEEFQIILANLQNLKSRYEALPQKRLQALRRLEASRDRLQLHAHLDRCRISRARIKGVGDAKKVTLQSYGIETAADIVDHRVLAVPGFGPVLLSNLKGWRAQQERRFVFDPNKGIDQAAKNAVERQISVEKIDLERKLNEGLSKLTVSSHHILTRRRTLLAQAEQTAHELAQAEADLRASSAISPTVRGICAILALGAISIGGVTIALHQSNKPSVVISRQMPLQVQSQQIPLQQVQPQQVQPPAASQLPPVRPTFLPHVEKDPSGQVRPEDGYDWSDANHLSVRWISNKISREHPHVITSDTEGEWLPEDGYDWVDPNKRKDKLVKWVPGIVSNRYPNVVADATEGQWQPADGYTWVLNPPRSGDMRVKSVPPPESRFSMPVPEDPSQRGLADRAEFEQWVAALSGDFRLGADWWAGRRSLLNPGACNGPTATSQDFMFGCEAAKARLTPMDIKRKSDPVYRRGWNSYTGPITSPSAPDAQGFRVEQVPTVEQIPMETPPDSDTESAARLNAQELKKLLGQ
jgi:hypothetical protein